MELRQLRYFVRIVELGSIGRAALELGLATSAVSQQMKRLEGELGTPLLYRRPNGTAPTEAGTSFYRSAQLVLRHADDALESVRRTRLTGRVSIGLTPATTLVLAPPFYQTMKEKHPGVELHFVEAFSGYLSHMLKSRQLDLAILFQTEVAVDWIAVPLLKESLFAMCSPTSPHAFTETSLHLEQLAHVPLILPSKQHGLRRMLDAAFAQKGITPTVSAEVDSLQMLIEMVRLGHGVTIQQSAVAARTLTTGLNFARMTDAGIGLHNLLVSLSDQELSETAQAARNVIRNVATTLVRDGRWIGSVLSKTE